MDVRQAASSALAIKEPSCEEHPEGEAQLSDPRMEAIREELFRLMASSRFSTSHRCQALLRHTVENVLAGKADSLKERVIGSEVFGRNLSYDTNSDPVVRMAAGEVRKRLAQFYYDPANHSKVRIELPAGSYVPVFSWPDLPPQPSEESASEIADATDGKLDQRAESSPRFAQAIPWTHPAMRWLATVGAMAIVAVLAVVAILLFRHFQPKPPDAFESFWAPVVKSSNPVLVCVGHRMLTWSQYNSDGTHGVPAPPAKTSQFDDQRKWPGMALHDAIALTNLAGLFQADKKPYSVRGQAFTRFEDLQKGPVVLVGSFNNNWTMQLMKSMRFHFEKNATGSRQWIADQQNTAARIGAVQADMSDFTSEDYAIVARTFDPQTRQPTIIAAGVTATATHAAGDFITNPVYLNEFAKKAPDNWSSKNMELLIVANDVNGDSGPPRVVSSYFW